MKATIAVEDALERIAAGAMVLVVDHEDREDEGDLVMAAQHVTPEAVNFMIRQACGLVCLPCDGQRLDDLAISPMVVDNSCAMQTAFTVSIDLRSGGSGISAHDRAATVRASGRPRPGWRRRSRAPVTSSRCGPVPAGCWSGRATPKRPSTWPAWPAAHPAAMICEVLDDDGSPARRPRLQRFAVDHGIGVVTIDALDQPSPGPPRRPRDHRLTRCGCGIPGPEHPVPGRARERSGWPLTRCACRRRRGARSR